MQILKHSQNPNTISIITNQTTHKKKMFEKKNHYDKALKMSLICPSSLSRSGLISAKEPITIHLFLPSTSPSQARKAELQIANAKPIDPSQKTTPKQSRRIQSNQEQTMIDETHDPNTQIQIFQIHPRNPVQKLEFLQRFS